MTDSQESPRSNPGSPSTSALVANPAASPDTAASSPFHVSPATIAAGAALSIAVHLIVRWLAPTIEWLGFPLTQWPLLIALVLGGLPLVAGLTVKLLRGEFGSDLLAGISIVTAVVLGEYLAGTLVVLMLSGGETLESFAVRSASSVLAALARRMPSIAHRKRHGVSESVALDQVAIGDLIEVFPHETCPVDGTVVEGRGQMDESYLTGEPYLVSKAPGAAVLSGAINGASVMTIRADRLAVDSRYAKIMQIMRDSEQRRPRLRRLGDQLGAWYTPLAVGLALVAWGVSGESIRFLGVLVVATPCPLLIAIPVAIIGSISLAARHGIIIKDPAVLERIDTCRTAIFDKTGTLTYGQPRLDSIQAPPGSDADELLRLVASLERYSKHPLASAILTESKRLPEGLYDAAEVSERPGAGLTGHVNGRKVEVTSRAAVLARRPDWSERLPPRAAGLECLVLLDDDYGGTFQFRDQPRREGAGFVNHLGPKHQFDRVMLVSGDRESEVRYLAEQVGISEVYFSQSPEQKLALVKAETKRVPTLFLGDGINDAPALTAATVGIAFGQQSDITSEAAGAVIMDSSLVRVDQFFHISRRLRMIALQSAIGGMLLSLVGMIVAALGYLPPVGGALLQEVIDVIAVVNALRVAWPPKSLTDF